jgi:Na+-translocating ferredoxin:NAD+ oxidoreductase subunit G
VLLLGFVYGGALAGVHTTLAPRIAENRLQETLNVMPNLVPGAVIEQTEMLSLAGPDGRQEHVYRTRNAAGQHNGWVLVASGQGFADRIEVLIGLDASLATITGIYVLDQKETPGLGDYIRDPSFLDRFQGKSADQSLSVVKTAPQLPGEIQALSGATISSWAVCDIVNQAIARLREPVLNELRQQTQLSTGGAVPE